MKSQASQDFCKIANRAQMLQRSYQKVTHAISTRLRRVLRRAREIARLLGPNLRLLK